VIGETWLDWLAGRIVLAGDASAASGVRLQKL
jgi:hypothetical protein